MAYKGRVQKVSGRKGADILLLALSTCGWCKKTKNLLNNIGIEYGYLDVDLLNEGEQKEIEIMLKDEYGLEASFPQLIINGKIILSGFDEERIRKSLDKT